MPATVPFLNTCLDYAISGTTGTHGQINVGLWYGANEVSSGGYTRLPITGFLAAASAQKAGTHRVSWTPSVGIFYDTIYLIGTGASQTLHYVSAGGIQNIQAGNTHQILISFSGTGT